MHASGHSPTAQIAAAAAAASPSPSLPPLLAESPLTCESWCAAAFKNKDIDLVCSFTRCIGCAPCRLTGNTSDERFHDGVPTAYRIDPKRWAVVCLVAKSGSSAWKALLLRGLRLQGFRDGDETHPHAQPLPYHVRPASLYDTGRPQLMFVRHPVSRLLSGFLGKEFTESSKLIKIPGYNVSSRSFAGFVQAVTSSPPEAWGGAALTHFGLASQQCGLGEAGEPKPRYVFLKVEDMGRWYRHVICQLGLQHAAASPLEGMGLKAAPDSCFVRTTDCGCEIECGGAACNASLGNDPTASFGSFHEASTRLEEFYDRALAMQVNRWAGADLRLFGYLPWLPGEPVRFAGRYMRTK